MLRTQELQLNYDRDGFNAVLGGFFLISTSAYDPFLISGISAFAGVGAAYIPDTDPNRVADKDNPVELGTHLYLRAVQKTKSYAIRPSDRCADGYDELDGRRTLYAGRAQI